MSCYLIRTVVFNFLQLIGVLLVAVCIVDLAYRIRDRVLEETLWPAPILAGILQLIAMVSF